MKLLIENWRKYLKESRGPFTASYQLFIPRKCPDEVCDIARLENTPPVENRPGRGKPYGGLWTSTAKSQGNEWTSAWNEWMMTETPHWMHSQGIILKSKTANIFHIENDEDARMLAEEFPLEDSSTKRRRGGYSINFETALQKYDGIHYGLRDGEDSDAWDFGESGKWDTESTIFRDASVVDIIEIVSVVQSGGEEWY